MAHLPGIELWQHLLFEQVGACGRGEERDRVHTLDAGVEEVGQQMRVEDRSGAVADRVHGDRAGMVGDVGAEKFRHPPCAATGSAGRHRIILHRVPQPFALCEPRERFEHAIAEVAEQSAGARREHARQRIGYGVDQPCLPDEMQGIGAVVEPPADLPVRDPQAVGLRRHAAVGVEHERDRAVAVLGDVLRQMRFEDRFDIGVGGEELTLAAGFRRELAVAQIHDVGAQCGDLVRGESGRGPSDALCHGISSGGTVRSMVANGCA
ncbi:hypothetical protein ACWDTG_09725 [Rhodococcus zopfii]